MKWFSAFVCACLGWCQLASAAEVVSAPLSRDELRLAIVNSHGPDLLHHYFSRAVLAMEQAVAPVRVSVTYHDPDSFHAAAIAGAFDIAIASSGLTSYMIERTGGLPMLTMVSDDAPDPNYSTGGTIIVRADRDDIQTLADLKGKSAAVMSRQAFAGWQLPMAEFMRHKIDTKDLFSSVVVTGAPMTTIVQLVGADMVDVGFITSCLLERMAHRGQILLSDYKVINEQFREGHMCRHSTELYPGWTISMKPTVPAPLAKKIIVALLNQSKDAYGHAWTVPTDQSRFVDLFKRLQLPLPHDRDLSWVLREYKNYVIGALLALIVGVGNIFFLIYLVRRRTAQVEQVLHEKFEAQTQATQMAARMESLQKVSAIGMISSMVAHELKQPLTVIANYSGSLKRRLHRGTLSDETLSNALEEIERSGLMASDIIERVRSYARVKSREYVSVNVGNLVQTVVERQIKHAGARVDCRIEVQPNVWVQADRLELELVVLNLLKNAYDVVKPKGNPRVDVIVKKTEHYAYVVVRDNGPTLSDEELEKVGQVGHTTKANGMGFGLSIVKTLLEAHGGSLSMERRTDADSGLEATVKLPLEQTQKE